MSRSLRSYGRAVLVLGALTGCQTIPPVTVRISSPSPSGTPLTLPFQSPVSGPSTTPVTTPSPSAPTQGLPPVEGPAPAANVAAFYYPWYGPVRHWHDSTGVPPSQISSDYWPVLGAYSSADRLVVAQHMAWLRRAGIGMIVSSWWGQGSYEDAAVPLLLEMAQQYGIKVCFHIEPYGNRSASGLLADIRYIYDRYGTSPAFFRSPATSRYSSGPGGRGVFFAWAINYQYGDGPQVTADYWRAAVDAAHALPGGALVIANTEDGTWVTGGHFDGLYNYATLHLDSSGFDWAHTLPPKSLYVPSVIPGFSGKRIGDPADTFQARDDGKTYDAQWTEALATGVEPALMTITSFNEWHEGTQIEPAAVVANGTTYDSYSPLAPEAYLDRTRTWIGEYEAATFPAITAARFEVRTTSDWTNVQPLGADVLQSELISRNSEATDASLDWRRGDKFSLSQLIARAEAGKQVSMVWDVGLAGLTDRGRLRFQITRGGLGATTVVVYNMVGGAPVQVAQFSWAGTSDTLNTKSFSVAMDKLLANQP